MIISQNSNDVYYAYTRGRFWRWDGSARVWKESHLLAQKFDKAKAAEKHLTPEAFLTGDEFIPMDDYELPQSMLTALRDAKPCKMPPSTQWKRILPRVFLLPASALPAPVAGAKKNASETATAVVTPCRSATATKPRAKSI